MDDRYKLLEDQIDKLNLKIDAICEAYGIRLDYTPGCYEVYKLEKDKE